MTPFTQKGSGKSTYYLPSKLFKSFLSPQAERLSPQAEGLLPQADGLLPQVNLEDLPKELQDKIKNIGKRSNSAASIKEIIVDLCDFQPISISELSNFLNRGERYIRKPYIKELMEAGKLAYTIPQMISHPNQKYRTVKKHG